VAILAAGADRRVPAQVTAAVLLWRAVTYLPPYPARRGCCLVWRHARALIGTGPGNCWPGKPCTALTTPAGRRRMPRTDEMNMYRAPCHWTLPVAGAAALWLSW